MNDFICVDKWQWLSDPYHCDYLEVKASNRNEAKRYYSVYTNGQTQYIDVKCILKKNKYILQPVIF